MVAIFGALLWYVGIGSLYNALLNIKIEYLLLAFLMYFGINLLFTVRLRRVLSKDGVKTSFGKTLLAQYAGMLTSDVTPGRSGYILTPVYLRDQNVPTSKSLSSILGIQTIEFLVKVIGGIGAVIFLVKVVPAAELESIRHFCRNKHWYSSRRIRYSVNAYRSNLTGCFHMVSKSHFTV